MLPLKGLGRPLRVSDIASLVFSLRAPREILFACAEQLLEQNRFGLHAETANLLTHCGLAHVRISRLC